MDHTLKHIQTELAEEQQRLAHLREAFQVQYRADELDAAGLLATAHLAQSRAARSAQRIRGLQSLLDFLRHGGRPLCEDCGEEIPIVRLLAAPGATRCRECQQLLENGESGPTTGLTAENRSMHGLAGNC